MLVELTNGQVGILVEKWRAFDREVGYVLVPYKWGKVGHALIFGASDDEYKPLTGYDDQWVQLKEDIYGYSQALEDTIELEDVWDNGDASSMRSARKLYDDFHAIIDSYTPLAIEYLKDKYQKEYDQAIVETASRGWDKDMIELREAQFPYRD